MPEVEGVLTAAAHIAFEAAEHGDLRAVDEVLLALPTTGDVAVEAWRFALESIRWSLRPAAAPRPDLERARSLAAAGGSAANVLARACAVMERTALSTLDAPALAEWSELHETLSLLTGSTDDLDLATARLWRGLLGGETGAVESSAKAVGEEAAKRGAAAPVIEATVMRALLALAAGQSNEAVELGRRASRMAQAEALSHQEYLANMALARIRRFSGRPHLALHILAALDREAPATWAGWIGWETLLAGGTLPPERAGWGPIGAAAHGLRRLLEVARGGDRAAFDEAASDLDRVVRTISPWLRDETAALLAALDPLRAEVPPSMADWLRGDTPVIPFGLHGVGTQPATELQTESATAYVVARPGEPGRRFLLPGLALAPQARMLARDSARSGARTETGIAALALVEGGVSRDRFFRSVYGFPFVPYRHRAVLDMLCHRMRGLLGSAGTIRRNEAELDPAGGERTSDALEPNSPATPWITLVLREPIVVPDMRCVLPVADRVLRALALLGATSARSAADSLKMPLRTVQAVLQQLVAEGACRIERDGRRIAYRIEDTTFTDVTSV
jgi:hypothetical protein